MAAEHVLLRHRDLPGLDRLDVYLEHGGFAALRRAVTEKSPQEVIDLVKASGLRGRGGAGFPAGVKWSFLSKDVFPRYVVVNADESEPGTFKDREIMERNPFQFLEGVAICAYAAQAETAYIYCRGEFWDLASILEERIEELRRRGLLGKKLFGTDFSLDVFVHLGAGAYICGEETALLKSLEGKLGQPRLRPPFPAARGLYALPTVVNNVETSPICPRSWSAGSSGTGRSGPRTAPGRRSSRSPVTWRVPGTTNSPWGPPSVR